MNDSLQFLFLTYVICIFISVLTLLTTLFFVVPLQVKRVYVKNGLQSLRQKLLTNGLLSLVMSVITVFILSSRFFISGDIVRYLNTALIFFFTAIWFVRSLIETSIYHTQFTEDQIKLHHKMYDEEMRRERKKETTRVKLNSDRRKATRERQTLT